MKLLENILGTRTKVRMITALARSEEPKTRYELFTECGGSAHGLYDQVEQLIATGVVRVDDGKVSLDQEFIFYDHLINLVMSMEAHVTDLEWALSRLDELLGEGYYIGGFWAARQETVPYDYEAPGILVNVVKHDRTQEIRLETLSNVSGYDITARSIDFIPDDVTRTSTFNAEYWTAGIERGLVESLLTLDCSTYGAYLLFVQNIMESDIDLEAVKRYSLEMPVGKEYVLALINAFNDNSGREMMSLDKEDLQTAAKGVDSVDPVQVKNALSTVFG